MHAAIATSPCREGRSIWRSSHLLCAGQTSSGRRYLSDRLVKALRSRTGLLDEVDGAPLALKDARQVVRSRRGDCNCCLVLAFAVLALPALPFDHDAGVIAVFDVEPLDSVKV